MTALDPVCTYQDRSKGRDQLAMPLSSSPSSSRLGSSMRGTRSWRRRSGSRGTVDEPTEERCNRVQHDPDNGPAHLRRKLALRHTGVDRLGVAVQIRNAANHAARRVSFRPFARIHQPKRAAHDEVRQRART